MSTADLLFHPVRLRVLQAMFGAGPLTTTQLRDRLPGVAPATLYRHVAVLADAGILEVVAEKRIRGTVERTYQVRQDRATLDPDGRTAMTLDDHRRTFTTFAASLLADFDRYLATDGADPAADGVAYRQAAVWLTDDEAAALTAQIEALVTARATDGPAPGRTRRLVSLISVPDPAST